MVLQARSLTIDNGEVACMQGLQEYGPCRDHTDKMSKHISKEGAKPMLDTALDGGMDAWCPMEDAATSRDVHSIWIEVACMQGLQGS